MAAGELPGPSNAARSVDALRAARGDDDIVAACYTMLAVCTGANYDAFVEAGGMEVLVDLVRTGTTFVRGHAACTIGRMTIRSWTIRSNARKQTAVASGVLLPLLALLADGDVNGKESAARMLSSCAYGETRADVLAVNAIAPLAAALQSHEGTTSFYATRALRNLAEDDADVQQQMLGPVLGNARAMAASDDTVRRVCGKDLLAFLEPLSDA